MVKRVETISTNCAKSFLGKNVNVHMRDGSVIVNVHLGEIRRDEFKRQRFVTYIPYGDRNASRIPLKNIAWVELLNLNLIVGR